MMSSRFFSSPNPPYFYGPFKTNQERYLKHCDVILSNIGKDGCYEDDAEIACLMYLWVKELVSGCEEMEKEDTVFYMKHADDKCDQFLTIDDNIQAVIDWEW